MKLSEPPLPQLFESVVTVLLFFKFSKSRIEPIGSYVLDSIFLDGFQLCLSILNILPNVDRHLSIAGSTNRVRYDHDTHADPERCGTSNADGN
jgi:hypothetical protein